MENYPANVQQTAVVEEKKPSKVFGIISLAAGGYGLLYCNFVAAIAAIVFGTISLQKNPQFELANTGRLLGLIGVVVYIIMDIVACILLLFLLMFYFFIYVSAYT